MIEHNLSSAIKEMGTFTSRTALFNSEIYKQHKEEIEKVLDTVELCDGEGVSPINGKFLRVLSWNIERGKKQRGIIDFLKAHPEASSADIILLQEVDQGMARTENKDVATEISSALNMHYAFVPQHLELSKGKERLEEEIPGEDEKSIHGIAILSRYKIKKAWSWVLHECDSSEHTFQLEPRIGRKRALAVQVEINGKTFTFVNVHLSVFTIPKCRLMQAKKLTEGLKDIDGPILIGGDFNTTAFRRGSKVNELYEAVRFLFADVDKFIHSITHPENKEPLFNWMEKEGFEYRDANPKEKVTAFTKLKGLADIKWMPRWIEKRVVTRLEKLDYRAPLNLDWFFLRNLKPLKEGEIKEPPSINPVALTPDWEKEELLSDHAAIMIDLPI
ncbi:endonuclease/exonuclease/phosphatase family protein [Bdellovibrionota bacterium]